MNRSLLTLCILLSAVVIPGQSLAVPPGRSWSPVEWLLPADHDGMLLGNIQANAAGGLDLIGLGYGVTDNGFYGLQWSDSAWVVQWRLDHQLGYIVRGLTTDGSLFIVWKTYAPTDPAEFSYMLVADVTGGTPGPIDTLGLNASITGNLYSAAGSAQRRWVVWMDRMRTDFSRAEIRIFYSDFGQGWREAPALARNPSEGLAIAALGDTTLLLVWGEVAGGLKWGTLTGSVWEEGSPPPTSYWAARVPRLSPRKGGGYWLGWLQSQQALPYNHFAAISSFVSGSWSQPESLSCLYPSTGQWLSDAFALSLDSADFPAVAWNVYRGAYQDHSCISCPADSGPSVADAIASTSTRSSPQPAIDLNGDIWLAWHIHGNTTYWVHTYTQATSSVPTVGGTGNKRLVAWQLSEPAPGSWWAVLRAGASGPFTEVARVQAGAELTMNWADLGPHAGPVRYRIRRECLDARYQWLSPEGVLDVPQISSGGAPLRLEWASSNPSGQLIRFEVMNAPPGLVDVRLHDVSGRLILIQRPMASGSGRDLIDLDLVASSPSAGPGLYFLRVVDATGRASSSVKVVFMR